MLFAVEEALVSVCVQSRVRMAANVFGVCSTKSNDVDAASQVRARQNGVLALDELDGLFVILVNVLDERSGVGGADEAEGEDGRETHVCWRVVLLEEG